MRFEIATVKAGFEHRNTLELCFHIKSENGQRRQQKYPYLVGYFNDPLARDVLIKSLGAAVI